jgi:hypothetical protein
MWDRTLTIGSAGKSFSVTGWKVRRTPLRHPTLPSGRVCQCGPRRLQCHCT